MPQSFLPKIQTDDIDKIAIWDAQDVAPAGSKDPALIGDDTGSLNGNWIRFRNYVNALKAETLLLATKAELSLVQNAMAVDHTSLSQAQVAIGILGSMIGQTIAFGFAGVTTDNPEGEFATIGNRQTTDSIGQPVPKCKITSVLVSLSDGTVQDLVPFITPPGEDHIDIAAPSSVTVLQAKYMNEEGVQDGYQSIVYVGGTGYAIGRTPLKVLFGTIIYRMQ